MNVVLACDSLLERDHSTQILDLWAEMFEGVPLLTLAHCPGKILGSVEQRPILSTYLSRWVKNKKDLERWRFLAPGAVKTLKVPAGTEVVLSLSQGLIHHLPLTAGVKHFSYLYDLPQIKKGVFSHFLQAWLQKDLEKVDCLWASSEVLKKILPAPAQVLYPFFKHSDYAMAVPDLARTYYVVSAEGLSLDEAKNVIAAAQACAVTVKFVGKDEHLQAIKTEAEFWGERCAGDLAQLLYQARAFLDFSHGHTYPWALAALGCQTPVALRESALSRELFTEAMGPKVSDLGVASLSSLFHQLEGFWPHFNRSQLQARALKASESKFKNEILKGLQGVSGSVEGKRFERVSPSL